MSFRATLQKLIPQLLNTIFIACPHYMMHWLPNATSKPLRLEGSAHICRISSHVVLYTRLSPAQVPLFVLPFVIVCLRTEFKTEQTHFRCVLTIAQDSEIAVLCWDTPNTGEHTGFLESHITTHTRLGFSLDLKYVIFNTTCTHTC